MDSAVYYTTTPTQICPAAATGTSVTPSGVSQGYSAWVEMEDETPEAWRLAAIVVLPGSFAVGNFYEIEIGTGLAGSETTVAAQRGYSGNNDGGTGESGSVLTFAIPADVIRRGDRVSCRMRQVSTNTSTWHVAIQYWPRPLDNSNQMPVSTVGPVNVPSGSQVSASSSATAWQNGSWVAVTAATDARWTITNVCCVGSNLIDWEMDIGLGASGSEIVRWTVKSQAAWFVSQNAWQGGPWNILLMPALGPIDAGTRVSVRMRKSGSGAVTFGIGLTVTKQAVSGASTQQPLKWVPSATGLTTVTAAGGWNNFGAWVQFIASTSTGIALCNIASTRDDTGTTVIEVGVGASGQEVVVARMVVAYGVAFGGGKFNLTLPYARFIPAGSRVAVRTAVEHSSITFVHSFALGYIECETPDFANWTDSLVPAVYGTPSVTSVASGSGAWANGSWTQIESSLPVDRILAGYAMASVTVPMEAEFDFGLGASGSEEVVATERWEATNSISGCSMAWTVFGIPRKVGVGARLAIRARASSASPATFNWFLLYSTAPAPPEPPEPPAVVEQPIVWVRRTPTIIMGNKRVFYRLLEPHFQQGVGTANPPGDDPQCALRTSDDGGYTWSSIREAAIGMRGNYSARTRFLQLGSGRRRQFEVSGSCKACLIGAELEADEGTS